MVQWNMAQTFGVDLSSYQGNVDFGLLSSNSTSRTIKSFAWTRVNYGTELVDSTFGQNRDTMRLYKDKFIAGYYDFAVPNAGHSGVDEAEYFLSHMNDLKQDEFIVLDVEVDAPNLMVWVQSWLDHVRDRYNGYLALVYTNQDFLNRYDWSSVINSNHGLILADPDNNPDIIPTTKFPVVAMKQYSETGKVAGINGDVDLDVFYGDIDTLRKYGYQPPVVTPAPVPTPEPPTPDPIPYPIPIPTPVPEPTADELQAQIKAANDTINMLTTNLANAQKNTSALQLQLNSYKHVVWNLYIKS